MFKVLVFAMWERVRLGLKNFGCGLELLMRYNIGKYCKDPFFHSQLTKGRINVDRVEVSMPPTCCA